MTAENSYRQTAYQTASTVGMVIALFDYAIDSLNKAILAIESGDIEKRTNEVGRAITAIGELQGGLDLRRGGDVARRMERFYSLVRGQMLEGQIKSSRSHFQHMLELLTMVRDAWQQAERNMNHPAAHETTDPVASLAIMQPRVEQPTSVQWSA